MGRVESARPSAGRVMPKTFKAWIEMLHFLAGVQAGLGLVIFSVATLAVVLPESSHWERSEFMYAGEIPALDGAQADLALARALHAEWGHRFEQRPQRWMLGPQDDVGLEGADLLVRFYSPNGERRFRLDAQTGRVEIEREVIGPASFLNRIHQESLGRRRPGDSLWIWVWSLYLETMTLGLLVLPITGACLWVTRGQPSRPAIATLVASLVLCVGLWAGLR